MTLAGSLVGSTMTQPATAYSAAVPPVPPPTLQVSDTSILAGDEVKFSGRMVAGKLNQYTLVQILMDGRWRRVGMDYTNRRGLYAGRFALDYPAGTYKFRALGRASRLYEVPRLVTKAVRIQIKARPGTMELPWRPGQSFSTDDWRFVFGVADLDAWPERLAHYSEADPPPPGWAYVSVPMGFTRTGAGSGRAWIDHSVRLVGGDGVVYSTYATINGEDYHCALANDWSDAPELYTGASGSGSACLVVQQSAIAGGLWRIGDYDAEQFVTLN